MNCKKCNRKLTVKNIFALDEDIFCRVCFHELVEGYIGVLTQPHRSRYEAEEDKK